MITIGITGGIGSGKSTVCKIWEAMGARIIDADELARQIMVRHAAVRKQLIETFGPSVFHPDDSLNRPFLAKEAFQKGRVDELNAIVHPHIPAELKRRSRQAERQGEEVLVYEAALLLQTLHRPELDYIVLILANENDRITRVSRRDETNRRRVRDRINKQQHFERLTSRADVVLRNDGSLAELKTTATATFNQLLKGRKD